jgi:hypothetical protein
LAYETDTIDRALQHEPLPHELGALRAGNRQLGVDSARTGDQRRWDQLNDARSRSIGWPRGRPKTSNSKATNSAIDPVALRCCASISLSAGLTNGACVSALPTRTTGDRDADNSTPVRSRTASQPSSLREGRRDRNQQVESDHTKEHARHHVTNESTNSDRRPTAHRLPVRAPNDKSPRTVSLSRRRRSHCRQRRLKGRLLRLRFSAAFVAREPYRHPVDRQVASCELGAYLHT